MWFALTVLLLDILLPNKSQNNGNVIEDIDTDGARRIGGNHDQKISLPSSVVAIGINEEEYLYLTQTAIPTLSKGSADVSSH